ncbi:hypothetical protein B9Z19DRAFT_1164590 [Tuber borchii]|uniref:Uncharacterized protein n=1 Tax=Tuber borchii TaxID=42251 RepID=A0A2T6ZCE4_TUBBO|nr:hypothetical protein B9Z19DRAFT_1164590 [Tuber borchii]
MDAPVSPSSPRREYSEFDRRDGGNRYGTGGPIPDPAYNPLQRHTSTSESPSPKSCYQPAVLLMHSQIQAEPHWVQALGIVSPVAMMAGLFLLGIAFTIGHYVFYRSWRDNIVEGIFEQEYIIRAGTAFAFLSKASLVGAVVVAHKKIAWKTVRNKAITIDGINAMFVAPTDLTSFWNGDMLRKAKTATILALLTWCIPISAIVTPSSLSVSLVQREYNISALIPSTNFSDPTEFVASLGFRSSVPKAISSAVVATSALLSRIVSTTATSGSILPIKPPEPNSSYVYSFHGPSFRLNYDKAGRTRYAAFYNPPINANACSIHVGLVYNTTIQNGTYRICSPNGGGCMFVLVQETDFDDPDYGQAFSCGLYNTFFAVNITFRGSGQIFGIQKLEHLSPISCVPLAPFEGLRRPSTVWKTSHAVFAAMGDVLVGNITKHRGTGFEGFSPVSWGTKILQTSLIGSSDFARMNITKRPNGEYTGLLARGIEELSQNITLSLLSSDALGLLIKSDVLATRQSSRYLFNERNFWLAYGIAIFVTAGATLVGVTAYITNGVSFETNFSTVMATTQSGEMQESVQSVAVDSRELRNMQLQNGDRRFVIIVGEAKG